MSHEQIERLKECIMIEICARQEHLEKTEPEGVAWVDEFTLAKALRIGSRNARKLCFLCWRDGLLAYKHGTPLRWALVDAIYYDDTDEADEVLQ